MFYHIVLFKLKPAATKEATAKTLGALESLLSKSKTAEYKVAEISSERPSQYQYIQFTVFTDRNAMDDYRNQPGHQVVKDGIKKNLDYEVVDFET